MYEREDDTAFKKGVAGKNTREIFMNNGSYLFCEIIRCEYVKRTRFPVGPQKEERLVCRTPSGREFFAKYAMGTVCELDAYDEIKPLWTVADEIYQMDIGTGVNIKGLMHKNGAQRENGNIVMTEMAFWTMMNQLVNRFTGKKSND